MIETQKHSHYTACLMARLASMAYESPGVVAEHLELINRHELPGETFALRCFDDQASDTQCFVASCSSFAVLSFRGTETDRIRDLATDARFTQSMGPYISRHSSVHAGFWSALRSLIRSDQGQLIEFLHDATDGHKPLLITGHSLGGALATLMAAWLGNGHWPGLTVYTFGSPRCGNRGFAALYDHCVPRTFRYVYGLDHIPRIPWQLGRYRHVGELCYISRDYQLHREPSVWLYQLKRYVSLTAGLMGFAKSGLADHSMTEYLAAATVVAGVSS